MKRKLILIILLVLVAATINLAFALCFWWFGERPPTPSEKLDTNNYGLVDLRPQEVTVWRIRRETDWPDEPDYASMHDYLGVTYRTISWRKSDDSNANIIKVDTYLIEIVELGWPMRCIAGEQLRELHLPKTPWQGNTKMFIAFGAHWPNRLLWTGMIVNVLFYCAVIALTYFCWIYIRRTRRRRRGCCLKCAYDLRGDHSAGCPECGWRRTVDASA